jgi:transcriptional regulator PpsR
MFQRNGPPADLSALSSLAPELAEMLVAVACDIALVLDDGGVVQSVSVGGTGPGGSGGAEPVASTAGEWVGRRWADTVTSEARGKAEQFLDDVAATGKSRLRHLNHESRGGTDIPIAYTAVRLGESGPTLALGRDLRLVSAMQDRLVQAQQDMERDYWRERQSETRYRLLFHVATEPVLVVDASTFEILDANRAAGVLFGLAADKLLGRSLIGEIEPSTLPALQSVLDLARSSGHAADGAASLSLGRGGLTLTVTPFQSESSNVLLLRLRGAAEPDPSAARAQAVFAGLAQRTPDAIVITDLNGGVILANAAFRELVHVAEARKLTGRKLGDWIGTASDGVLPRLLETARSEGPIRLLRTELRREDRQTLDIELSATLILDHDLIGFIIRASHHKEAGLAGSHGRPDSSMH